MKSFLFAFYLLMIPNVILAQKNTKKSVDVHAIEKWKSIKNTKISPDGNWVAFEETPNIGSGILILFNPITKVKQTFSCATNHTFSPNSDFLVYKIVPHHDTIRKYKIKKIEKEKYPKDDLGIFTFNDSKTLIIKKVKSYKTAIEKSSWIAIHYEKESDKKDTLKKEPEKKEKNRNRRQFNRKPTEASEFEILNPVTQKKYAFKNIIDYTVSRNGSTISFIRQTHDSVTKSTILIFNTLTEKLDSIYTTAGYIKKITLDNTGNQLAYIHSNDSTNTKIYSLYYWNHTMKKITKLVDTLTKELPAKWTVSENGELYFSHDDNRLYFGTAISQKSEPKDTIPDDEKIGVDIWSWDDPRIQPQQLNELEKDKNKWYLAVYNIQDHKIIQLANEQIPFVKTIQKGNGVYALGLTSLPYLKLTTWEAPSYFDVYLINTFTGEKELIRKKFQSYINISANGKYIISYENTDSSWYSYSIQNKNKLSLTRKIPVNFFNEENDIPKEASAYGIAGWTQNDQYVLIYDKYDIWRIDPSGSSQPVCLTRQYGKKNSITFRYITLDDEATDINYQLPIFLSAFNKNDKSSGFYSANIIQITEPQKIIYESYNFNYPVKAKNANKIVWSKESFTEFPNLWYSDMNCTAPIKISDTNPQQKEYNWGTVELINWTTFNGEQATGLLYKPENFDATKRYPMIVYFYETYSDELHQHYIPKFSRSIINFTHYVSNEYLVFVPDIKYYIGYPGKSAFNYILSGVMNMILKPYVDKDHIGLQGQSWGGYQTAYLITQSNLFKAAMAGAPVSDMISAYGGIRWESGMSRMFQYEQTQSRIGGSLWDKTMLYIENSPIFFADRIKTPLLIMSNDNDGAVPWYQGIELYMALRRLQKPVWLLNYNGEPHNLKDKSPNGKDLTIRMMQFFDYYLKEKPAPIWLKKGIPAIEKGKNFGYKFE